MVIWFLEKKTQMCLSFCSLTVQRIIFWVINVICHLFGRISRISWLAFSAFVNFWLAIRLSFYHKWLQRQEMRGCLPNMHYGKYTTWHWMSKQMFKVRKTKLSRGKWFGENKWLNFQELSSSSCQARIVKLAIYPVQCLDFSLSDHCIKQMSVCQMELSPIGSNTLLSPLSKPVLILSQ